jgi:phosphotransferase system HPr-like phosphotransfer protein
MVSKKIKLAGIEQVQTFNQICSRCEYNVDLKQGKYLVDAKSIMGIYSLNIMGELELQVGTDSEKEVEETFKDYII